jgi:hypothetical protein
MKERGMLFSKPMVLALLDGSKTQTRRLIKVQPQVTEQRLRELGGWVEGLTLSEQVNAAWQHGFIDVDCPYGKSGDRIWVRETWRRIEPGWCGCSDFCPHMGGAKYDYFATGSGDEDTKWKPSIHMPRGASRIDLEITGVRVERLQNISKADAIAEGAPPSHRSIDRISREFGYKDFPRSWYAQLWDQINGAGSWDGNPWCWVIEFKRIKP